MKNSLLLLLWVVISSCNEQSHKTAITSSAGNDGIVYFSTNNGLTWDNKSQGLPATAKFGLGAIAVSDSSLAITTREHGIFLFDLQKNSWVSMPTDKQIIESNPGSLTFYKGRLFVATQLGGVFTSSDRGITWTNVNTGLQNLTIRKLVEIDTKLYAGTNAGLYVYEEAENKWRLEYGNNTLQVNGITALDGVIYIATNQGAFARLSDWMPILPNRSLHNITSENKTIYAMTYNELFSSIDKGKTWQSIQHGLPDQLYTFNVVKHGDFVFAGQWDGVYRREKPNEYWRSYSKGLPEKYAVTNMKVYNAIIVVTGSERVLKHTHLPVTP